MRKIFLTSSMGTSIKVDGEKIPCKMDNTNNMIERINSSLLKQNKLVIIVSDPSDFERNDFFHKINIEAFKLSGFNFNEVITIDNRNKDNIKNIIANADLIILGGGHVPTQNKWFKEIKLKELLKSYDGVLIGMSAGSMNCASTVYSPQEDESDFLDENYQKWIDGLGITSINVLPHYKEYIIEEINRLKIKEDIILPDSYKHPIYSLNDGSFIELDENELIIYGDCYKIHNGEIKKICEKGNSKVLMRM